MFGLVFFLSVASVGLGAAALGSPYWYEMTITSSNGLGGTIKVTSNSGLFRACVGSTCDDIKSYPDRSCPSAVVRKGSEMKDRIDTVKGTMFVAVFAGFAVAVIAIIGYRDARRSFWWWIFSFALIHLFSYIIAVVIYTHSVDYWYNCDATLCANIANCTFDFSYSYALAGTAMGLSLIATCIVFLLYNVTLPAKARLPSYYVNKPTGPPSPRTNPVGPGAFATRDIPMASRPPSPRAGTPRGASGAPIGDEWTFDSSSGMYWSTVKNLYLDPNTGHYFDAKSAQWYNPETGVWYAAS
jgi:hypothetical protein